MTRGQASGIRVGVQAGPIPPAARCPLMPTPNDRAERRDRRHRHAAEVEASQAELRRSIAETERLVDESEKMLRRHRTECDDADAQAGDG